jgi:hypothetical protein
MIRRVALVRTDVSEELNASFIRVTKIGELVGEEYKSRSYSLCSFLHPQVSSL